MKFWQRRYGTFNRGFTMLVVMSDLRKLFKTPIFERWGKQFCLN